MRLNFVTVSHPLTNGGTTGTRWDKPRTSVIEKQAERPEMSLLSHPG